MGTTKNQTWTDSSYRFVGDVHGKFNSYKKLVKDVPRSIQVGDMGVGFFKFKGGELKPDINPPFDAMERGDHRYIRGNHDNPSVCKQQKHWIPDGTYLEEYKMMLVGGATSTDKIYRTQGIDWWSNEELSEKELDVILEQYKILKPNIMITHEAPQNIADQILQAFNKTKINNYSNTRVFFERMLYYYTPKLWIFGHWHQSLSFVQNSTHFICLNELEHTDIDLNDYKE